MKTLRCLLVAPLLVAIHVAVACDSDHSANGPAAAEQTGQSCKTAAQCFPGLDAAAVHGAITCMDRVPGGYCTHECATDADCCAVPGECRTNLRQVCAPFESTGKMYCFLSCESTDITAGAKILHDAGTLDENLFCEKLANASFLCRSTGGGKNNRKVCTP
jgi:hypothetical protein